jgi:hypothetical protein
MKKTLLFVLSITVAFGITFYIKKNPSSIGSNSSSEWKTFVKKDAHEVIQHNTTSEEFNDAQISPPTSRQQRSVASVNPLNGFMVRKNRILMGEIDQKFEDETNELPMVNKINPNWKEIVGTTLMRFQPENTKVLVKEEVPVIKIQEGKGQYLQQISVTYMQTDGFKKSFKALVDSESGSIVTIWDRTIFESSKKTRGELTLPSVNDSGIIVK